MKVATIAAGLFAFGLSFAMSAKADEECRTDCYLTFTECLHESGSDPDACSRQVRACIRACAAQGD